MAARCSTSVAENLRSRRPKDTSVAGHDTSANEKPPSKGNHGAGSMEDKGDSSSGKSPGEKKAMNQAQKKSPQSYQERSQGPVKEESFTSESGKKSYSTPLARDGKGKIHKQAGQQHITTLDASTKVTTVTKTTVTTTEEDGQRKTPDSASVPFNLRVILAMLVPIIATGILVVAHSCFSSLDDQASRYTHFHTELSVMEKAFSKQTPRFWKLLRNPTEVHLNNTAPLRPLVIMLTGGPESSTVMECIAKKLAFAIDKRFNMKFEIHGRELKDSNGDEAKKLLDVKLRDHFGEGNHVAIIHNLELFPAPSPLIFYAYCDDQNAKFKTSTIIFTVQLQGAVPEHLTNIKKETFVTDFLKNTVWSGNPDVYGEDRIAALLSRITTSVAIVQEENNADKLCTESSVA